MALKFINIQDIEFTNETNEKSVNMLQYVDSTSRGCCGDTS